MTTQDEKTELVNKSLPEQDRKPSENTGIGRTTFPGIKPIIGNQQQTIKVPKIITAIPPSLPQITRQGKNDKKR